MAERNNSNLLDGGDSVGMTDAQYKGVLLDQLEDWQEVLDLATKAGNTEIQKKAEKQIAKINEKLKF
jgi:endo-alpha-1,4-polygalactosaminidase (GH114 family)